MKSDGYRREMTKKIILNIINNRKVSDNQKVIKGKRFMKIK